MIFHFKDLYPQLNAYWDKYLPLQVRKEIPAKTILLTEGQVSQNYIFIEKGCVRLYFNNKGTDATVQFFFENEGLTSLDSFLNSTPSAFSIESIEPSVIYLLPKKHVNQLLTDLENEPHFIKMILTVMSKRQLHYINEFVSFIRDTPEQRYLNLLKDKPHFIQRIPQHYIASYLGVSTVHLSRIKNKVAKAIRIFSFNNICYRACFLGCLNLS